MNVDEFINTLCTPASRKQNVTPTCSAEELQKWQNLLEEKQAALERYEDALAEREGLLNEIQKYLDAHASVEEEEEPTEPETRHVEITYNIRAKKEIELTKYGYYELLEAYAKGREAFTEYIADNYPWDGGERGKVVDELWSPIELHCKETDNTLLSL